MGCFFEYQLMGPPFSTKMNLNIDFRHSLSLAQSESEYPSMRYLSQLSQVIPRSLKPLRYRKIVFMTSMCWWPKFFVKRLVIEMVNAMSGLVSTIENIIDPIMP